MKLINRYIFINAFFPLVYLFIAFNLLFVVADLLENGVDFYKSNSSILSFIDYYALKLPSYSIIIIPICLLLSTVYSLNNLSKMEKSPPLNQAGLVLRLFVNHI